MPEDINRRQFVAVAALTGVEATRAQSTSGPAKFEEPACGSAPRCPYFDQPLHCDGKKPCEQ